eukprot:3445865-Amphidinium_carterae.2
MERQKRIIPGPSLCGHKYGFDEIQPTWEVCYQSVLSLNSNITFMCIVRKLQNSKRFTVTITLRSFETAKNTLSCEGGWMDVSYGRIHIDYIPRPYTSTTSPGRRFACESERSEVRTSDLDLRAGVHKSLQLQHFVYQGFCYLMQDEEWRWSCRRDQEPTQKSMKHKFVGERHARAASRPSLGLCSRGLLQKWATESAIESVSPCVCVQISNKVEQRGASCENTAFEVFPTRSHLRG